MNFGGQFFEFLLLEFFFPRYRFKNVKSCRKDWVHIELLQAPKMFNKCTTEHNIYFHNYHIVWVGKLCKSVTQKKGTRDDNGLELVEKHAGGVDGWDTILLSPFPRTAVCSKNPLKAGELSWTKCTTVQGIAERLKKTLPSLDLTHWHCPALKPCWDDYC